MSNPRVKVSRRGAFLLPEVAQALGPTAEGAAGADLAALYGRRWVLVWLASGGLQLYRDLEPVAPLNPLPTPPASARHIALAWDQGARPVIAWQDGAAVVVTQWDSNAGAFVQRGPFAGVDPCLIADATVMYQVAGSDVNLFYLTPDRLSLKHRTQRDFYALERDGATVPEFGYLDQVAALPWKVQAFIGTDANSTQVISSALYPITYRDPVAAQVLGPLQGFIRDVLLEENTDAKISAGVTGPIAGLIRDTRLVETFEHALTAGVSGPLRGFIRDTLLKETPSPDALVASTSGPISGRILSVLLTETLQRDALNISLTGPNAGQLVTVLFNETPTRDALAASLTGPTGGTYA